MNRAVIFHYPCFDGFGAAWAAREALGEEGVQYLPGTYGKPPVELGGLVDELYFVDFSYDTETMEKYLGVAMKVIVIDHHKTAGENLANLARHPDFEVNFDMDKSGAVMTWEYFHPGKPIPKLLLYIQDKDLWRFDLPNSQEINAALRMYEFDFPEWDVLLMGLENFVLSSLKEKGDVLLQFTNRQVSQMCDQEFTLKIGGHRVPVVNATAFLSEVADELLERNPDALFSAVFFDRGDDRTQWSLRSRKLPDQSEFDVSEVARMYGGGGHRTAAGFTTDRASRFDELDLS